MPLATTTPAAEAKMVLPGSALMSMPRCQPLRRRPKIELTGPSTGHMKAGAASMKSGTASSRPRGPRGAAGAGGGGDDRGRRNDEPLPDAQHHALVGQAIGGDQGGDGDTVAGGEAAQRVAANNDVQALPGGVGRAGRRLPALGGRVGGRQQDDGRGGQRSCSDPRPEAQGSNSAKRMSKSA